MKQWVYQTERLCARPWREEDLTAAKTLWGDPKVTQFIDARQQLQASDIEKKLSEQIEMQARYGIQYWPVLLKSTEEIIGCAGIRPFNLDKECFELGFHFIPAYWGKGYASEAVAAVIHYAFEVRHLKELVAGHHPDNHASKHLLEKLGFVYFHDEFYSPTGLMHPVYRRLPPA